MLQSDIAALPWAHYAAFYDALAGAEDIATDPQLAIVANDLGEPLSP